jgi:glycosyltransferase involved in cell wall biosynthesis
MNVQAQPGSIAPGTDGARISVVIPTYNRAHYLPQAIDSVLAQTCAPLEIIVVDDGSTDGTRDLVRGYGDRVRYIYTHNGGAGRARNIGMCQSRGDYVAFIDSDDVVYPYMLELESRVLDRHPEIALVYAEMSAFDDEGYFDRFHLKTYHNSAYRNPDVAYERLFESSATLRELGLLPDSLAESDPALLERRAYFGNIFDAYLTNLVVFQNNVLYRRSVLAAVGLRNERVHYYEEMDYILRISRAHRVCFVDVPTYKLRYHAGQLTAMDASRRGRYVWLRKQQELLRVVRRHALEDPGYYQRHRARVDRHLAHLHRAVAVPMMLIEGTRAYSRRARMHLARSAAYGHPHWGLWMATFGPRAVQRVAASVAEHARDAKRRLAARSAA